MSDSNDIFVMERDSKLPDSKYLTLMERKLYYFVVEKKVKKKCYVIKAEVKFKIFHS